MHYSETQIQFKPGNTNAGKKIPVAPVVLPPLPAVPTTPLPLIGPQPKPKPKVKPKKPTGAGSKTPSEINQIIEQALGLPDSVTGLKPRAGFIPALNMNTNKYGYVNRDFLKDMKPGPGTWMPGPPPNSIPAVAAAFWDPPKAGEQIKPAGGASKNKKKKKQGTVPNPNQQRIDEISREPLPAPPQTPVQEKKEEGGGATKNSTALNKAKIKQLQAKIDELSKKVKQLNKKYPQLNNKNFKKIQDDLVLINQDIERARSHGITDAVIQDHEELMEKMDKFLAGLLHKDESGGSGKTGTADADANIAIKKLEPKLKHVRELYSQLGPADINSKYGKKIKTDLALITTSIGILKEGKKTHSSLTARQQVSNFETMLLEMRQFLEVVILERAAAKKITQGNEGKGGATKASTNPKVGDIINFGVDSESATTMARVIGIEPGDGGKTQPMMVLQFLDESGKTMPEAPRDYPIGPPSVWEKSDLPEKNNSTPPPSDADSSSDSDSDSDSDSGSDSDSDSDSDNGLGPVGAGPPGGATKAGAKAGAKAGTKGDKWVQVRANISRNPPQVLVTGKIGDKAEEMMDFGLN